MSQSFSPTSGHQALRPKARILRTLGDELISSETVAVIELVKNAYDADATKVLVRFEEPLEIGQGLIEVIDNGHGMSLETIQSTWMEPATLYRKRTPRSEELKRRVLGEKGIGRFAASRLAGWLEVVTRRVDMNYEIRVFFDWQQFDDEEKYLDQVEVLWEETEPRDIAPGGSIEALFLRDEEEVNGESSHGTILRMEGLNTEWGKRQFESLRTGLSRLISPFGTDNTTQRNGFQIILQLPDNFGDISGGVGPSEMLKSPHYALSGRIEEDGKYQLELKLKGQEKLEVEKGQFTLQNGDKPQSGPFRIELRVWDRDQASMNELAHQYGSTECVKHFETPKSGI